MRTVILPGKNGCKTDVGAFWTSFAGEGNLRFAGELHLPGRENSGS